MEIFSENQNSNEMSLPINGTLFSFSSGPRRKQQPLCVGCVRGNCKRMGIFSLSECVETLGDRPGTDSTATVGALSAYFLCLYIIASARSNRDV